MGIDYRLRTYKAIERNILVDLLRIIAEGETKEYWYVGFGAEYYKDFILFHERLGINKMTSIEWNTCNKNRFEFNKPYNNIQLLFGSSAEKLMSIKFEDKMLVWLDFTDPLCEKILPDVNQVLANVKEQNIILFTFNIEKPLNEEEYLKTFNSFKPHSYQKSDLANKNYPILIRNTIDNLVKSELATRTVNYSHEIFFDFIYKDGAKMQTIGIIFNTEEKIIKLKQDLESNPFAFTKTAFKLDFNILTPYELIYLKQRMPVPCDDKLPWCNSKSESKKIMKSFQNIYRYYPAYAEITS